jgi:hypothetical protein
MLGPSNAPGPRGVLAPTLADSSAGSTAASENRAARRRAIATAHTLIVIIWQVLAQTTVYRDLGSDYFTRCINNPKARKRRLVRELQASDTRSPSNPPSHSQSQYWSPTNPVWRTPASRTAWSP